jgi:hypothetical protein
MNSHEDEAGHEGQTDISDLGVFPAFWSFSRIERLDSLGYHDADCCTKQET